MSKLHKDLQLVLRDKDFEIIERQPKQLVLRVAIDQLLPIAQHLKETTGFDHAVSVSVIDDLANKQFLIAYHLSSIQKTELHGVILTLEVVISRETPTAPSLFSIWPSVEFHEREGWEMFGINFEGHPKLERLLLPESWEGGYPLRKDFKLKERT